MVGARLWPLLLALCLGSGCAALIYEVVWFQLLGLVIGVSAVSLGVLLATFMGGLCIGSLMLWRVVSVRRHPLLVLAVLELGIGAIGLAVLYGMPALAGAYAASAGADIVGLLVRAAVAAVCLLPPTVLMGATLPALSRFAATTLPGVARLGLLYAANVVGAVLGTLLAGFYLLRVHDVAAATLVAVGVNAAVACASLALAGATRRAQRGTGEEGEEGEKVAEAARPLARPKLSAVHVAIALSGMTALAAEVIWTRHLSLLLGATVYVFALILAVFLLGLGLGSGAGSTLVRRAPAGPALAACQLLLCATIGWGAYAISGALPYWPLDVTLPADSSVMLQLDLVRVAWAILPAALLWGASFPLALAAAAPRERDPGRLFGGVYAANTVGAIIGALAASCVLVVWLGSRLAQQLLIALSAASGLLVLWRVGARVPGLRARRAGWSAAAVGAAAIIAWSVPELPGELVAFGRFMPTRAADAEIVYKGEGLTSSVAVSRDEYGRLTYHAAGKAQASSYEQDMRLQRMLGHLTTLAADEPESFLVIGLGAGITAGAVSIDPAVERVVVAEIERLVPEVAAQYFAAQNFGVLEDPKVELKIDDGRHFLATTEQTFDGITSDPLDPWVKGAAALYTREFWELVESRLNAGGVVTVFLQLYENTEEAVRSEIATFFDVFENGAVFANTIRGTGYDAVLLGRAGDAPIDVDRVYERLARPEYARVERSLGQVGLRSAAELLGTYAGGPAELADWLEGAPINRDRNMRLQYLAGEGLNRYRAEEIFEAMVSQGVERPDDLFTGSPQHLRELSRAIRSRRAR